MKFKIDGTELENVTSMKFLGIILDKTLCMKDQINELQRKCSTIIGYLQTLKRTYKLSNKHLISIYKSLLRSKIDYSFMALLNISKTNKLKMERIQNKALRCILNKPSNYSNKKLLEEANICSIEERVKALSKKWFEKSKSIPHHPLVTKSHLYQYIPEYDKKKTVHQLLTEL